MNAPRSTPSGVAPGAPQPTPVAAARRLTDTRHGPAWRGFARTTRQRAVPADRRVQEVDQAAARKREREPAPLGRHRAVGRAQHRASNGQRLLRDGILEPQRGHRQVERMRLGQPRRPGRITMTPSISRHCTPPTRAIVSSASRSVRPVSLGDSAAGRKPGSTYSTPIGTPVARARLPTSCGHMPAIVQRQPAGPAGTRGRAALALPRLRPAAPRPPPARHRRQAVEALETTQHRSPPRRASARPCVTPRARYAPT